MNAKVDATRTQENLVGLIGESVRRNWTRPALADWEGKGLTYGQVADEIARLHEIFRICRVGPGDKIALLGRNSASWAVVWLASVTYGAVVVPILPDFHPDDVHHIVNHSDSVLFFASDALFASLDAEKLRDVAAVFSLTDFRLCVAATNSKAASSGRTRRQNLSHSSGLSVGKACILGQKRSGDGGASCQAGSLTPCRVTTRDYWS